MYAVLELAFKNDGGEICRGLIYHDIKMSVPDAIAYQKGELSGQKILAYLPKKSVGPWWYQMGQDGADETDSQDYAYQEEELGVDCGGISNYLLQEAIEKKAKTVKVSLGIVFVGENPKGWDPDNNDDEGLMGNSYIPKRWKTIKLKRIGHKVITGGWKYVPVTGTVKVN